MGLVVSLAEVIDPALMHAINRARAKRDNKVLGEWSEMMSQEVLIDDSGKPLRIDGLLPPAECNCLKAAGLGRVSDLVTHTPKQLKKKVYGIGAKRLEKIEVALETVGLSLAEEK